MRLLHMGQSAYGIVQHDMIATIIWSEMMLHRFVCMADRNLPESVIVSQAGNDRQKFQIHHIIDDDRILPLLLVEIPRTDKANVLLVRGFSKSSLRYNISVKFYLFSKNSILFQNSNICLQNNLIHTHVFFS